MSDKNQPHTKISGGVSLLDRSDTLVLDSDTMEKLEPENKREKDQLSEALQTLLGKHPGAYLTNKMFAIAVPESRDVEIEFERFYFELNLLVMFYSNPINEAEHADVNADVALKSTFAQKHSYRFLPIIGSADGAQIMAALG